MNKYLIYSVCGFSFAGFTAFAVYGIFSPLCLVNSVISLAGTLGFALLFVHFNDKRTVTV